MSFKIGEQVKNLPQRKFPAKAKVYTDLINAMEKRPKGYYPITIEGKKLMTIYIALSKRLKGNTDLKLHIRGKVVFLEKL